MPADEASAALDADEIVEPSLAAEGFIHASEDEEQAIEVANRVYADADKLVALVIDESKVTAEIKREAAPNGKRYPHIYGPLNREAVVEVVNVRRNGVGRFVSL